jgi:hypothetical protein
MSSEEEFDFECHKCTLANLPYSAVAQDTDKIDMEHDGVQCNPRPSQCDGGFYDCFKKKGLHFLHLNARSLLPKLEEIKILAMNTNAAVMGITETWLDSSVTDTEIGIPNYLVTRRDRNREGGGVCLYIRSDLAHNPRSDISDPKLESIWCEILLPKTKPILVGACYRPPKQTDFFDILESACINGTRFSDLESIILGDFNARASM